MICAGRFPAAAVTLLLLSAATSAGAASSPPFGPSDYVEARQTCTVMCSANHGYCCTSDNGGSNKVPCTTGCHIAFFASDLQACHDECDRANDGTVNDCEYTHSRHPDVASLGFTPWWFSSKMTAAMPKCGGAGRCGCPTSSFQLENKLEACNAGCDIAHGLDADSVNEPRFFRGEDVEYDPRLGLDGDALLVAAANLTGHVDGTGSTLTNDEIDAAGQVVEANAALLAKNPILISAALNFIDAFEASPYGPLFINERTAKKYLKRDVASNDDRNIERAVIRIQQSLIDWTYHGTQIEFQTKDRTEDSPVPAYGSILAGRGWKQSHNYPGSLLDADANPRFGNETNSPTFSVDVDASMPKCWGRPTAFCERISIRPTGVYLVPGGVARVTVSPEVALHGGFKIQVGGHTVDNSNKNPHRRNDRITTTYDVEDGAVDVFVANPLGGSIYLKVPYLADVGLASVKITGGVVRAPFFRRTKIHHTTAEEWAAIHNGPGAWFDLETDNFLLSVPTSFMYGYSYEHMDVLAANWTKAMNSVSELLGFPPEKRNNYVMYGNMDRYGRYGSHGIGYPYLAMIVNAYEDGPYAAGWMSDGPGRAKHFPLTDPVADDTLYHELGHDQGMSKWKGEKEAANNFLMVYVKAKTFGEDYSLDEAFMNALGTKDARHTVDSSAVHWMIHEKFRLGQPMSDPEMKYQHRGFGKYADLARLYGWELFYKVYHEEHLMYEDGVDVSTNNGADDRTLRFSIAVGEDLTPLLHFWGTHPEDPASLKVEMESHNLYPSTTLRDHIASYAAHIPADQAEFLDHFYAVWPTMWTNDPVAPTPDPNKCNNPAFGCGWYKDWSSKWSTEEAQAAADAVAAILELYYDPETGEGRLLTERQRESAVTVASNSAPGAPAGSAALRASGEHLIKVTVSSDSDPAAARRELALAEMDAARESIAAKLNAARGRWSRMMRRTEEDSNYDFEYERDASASRPGDEWNGPFLVRVRSGSVASAEFVEDGRGPVDETIVAEIPTMEDLFALIQRECDGDIESIEVEYDEAVGHPKGVIVSYLGVGETEESTSEHYTRNIKLV